MPGSVVVSWSSLAGSLALQTNSDLSTTNWGFAGYTVTTSGPFDSVTLSPPPAGPLFFRLSSP
jgi:hypothetical protein